MPLKNVNGSPAHDSFNGPLKPVNGTPRAEAFPTLKSVKNGVPQQQNGGAAAAPQQPLQKAVAPQAPSHQKKGDARHEEVPVLKLNGFVGFDSLPNQLVKRCQRDGYAAFVLEL